MAIKRRWFCFRFSTHLVLAASCIMHLKQYMPWKLLLSVVRVIWISAQTHEKDHSQSPRYPSLQKVVNSRFLLVKYFTVFFQWHWTFLIFSKREAMKMQGNPPGSNFHFTFSTSNKIAALHVDEKEFQSLHISFLIILALKFMWI